MTQTEIFRSRVLKGTAGQAFAQLTHIVIRVIEIPLFLHAFGTQLYGEWLILYAIPSYLSLGGLGFVTAGSHEMAILIAQNKKNSAVEVFQSIGVLTGVISFLIAVILGGIVILAPVEEWFHFSLTDAGTVRAVIIILAIHLLVNIQANLAYSGFFSQGLYGEGLRYLTWIRIIEFLCLAASALYFSAVLASALGLLIGRLIGTAAMVIIVRRRVAWLRYGFSRASMESIKRLWPPAMASAAFPVGNMLNIQGFRLVVGAILGPKSLVLFSTLRTLARFSGQIISSINQIAQPELGMAFGKKDTELFRKIYRRSSQLSVWVGALSSFVLIALGGKIIEIWSRGLVVLDQGLFYWLILTGFVSSIWASALMVTYATNRHTQEAGAFIVVNAIALVVAFAAASLVGFSGIGATLVAVEISMAWLVFRRSHKLVGDTWKSWLGHVLKPPIFLLRFPIQILRARGLLR